MNLDIRHIARADHGRFETTVDGLVCDTDYRLADHVMTIHHTGVPAQLGGRGIAAALTKTALDHARAAGWKVQPVCSYARVYIERHPEMQALLA